MLLKTDVNQFILNLKQKYKIVLFSSYVHTLHILFGAFLAYGRSIVDQFWQI